MSRIEYFPFFSPPQNLIPTYGAFSHPLAQETYKLKLLYPIHWIGPLSPHAKIMEKKAQEWLRAQGILESSATEEKFEKLTVGEYANGPFPHAKAPRAEIITKFLALWIFYDDIIEEDDDGLENHLFDALAGNIDPYDCTHPHLRCWAELGQSYAQVMSLSWRQRHAKRFVEWIRSVREESFVAQEFRITGIYPSSAQHLERRRLNIGNLPNLDFLEYQMEQELSHTLWQDADFRHVENLAAEVVAIINDLFGFSKDRNLRWCNLVPCLAQEFKIPMEAAFQWSIDLHDTRIRQIQEQEIQLLAKYDQDPLLQDWLQGMHHVLYGFARWHHRAPRYCSHHQLHTGTEIQLSLDFFE